MSRRPSRAAGMVFILITLFLDILGLGIIIPVLPELISTQLFRRFTGEGALVELPGAPFFACTAFLLVSLMLVIAAFRRNPAP